jgi:TolB-like protein/class 3 adenylate cyclase
VSEPTRKLATIVALDVAGFSARTEADEERTIAQVANLRPVVESIAKTHGGRVFNTAGDGFMLEFASSFSAVGAALELADECRPRVRVGVHVGEVMVQPNGDLLGHGVNVAARLMAKAEPGTAIISADVCRLIRGPLAERFSSLGTVQLDKMAETIEIFAPATPAATAHAAATPKPSPAPARTWTWPSPRLAALISVPVLVIVAALMLWSRSGSTLTGASDAPNASIAVLPFENLSTDKDNAFFAAGIQDEILTHLSKIGALKVISRTSTEKYASHPDNLKEIAKELGVANVLEGSVQRAGDAVRVNVQLIRADTDTHLWAEGYDRKLDNIFSVQTEIATAVAEALNAKVTGSEQQALAQKPTSNVAAYDAYLRGLVLTRQTDVRSKEAAQKHFEDAVRLDPEFAVAWATLADIHADIFFDFGDATPARRAAARLALDNALRLGPDLPDTQRAEGGFKYYIERDYAGARKIYERLYEKWPNDADIEQALGLILRRTGVWDEAKTHLSRSIELDPGSPEKRRNAAQVYAVTNDFAAANRVLDEGLNLWPDNVDLLSEKARVLQAFGQLTEADALVKTMTQGVPGNPSIATVFIQARLSRQFDVGIARLEEMLRVSSAQMPERDKLYLKASLGELQKLAGDAAGARTTFLAARDGLQSLLTTQSGNAALINQRLAVVLVELGQTKEAMAAADGAVKALPTSMDALSGPTIELSRAQVLALMGDRDRAIPELKRLLIVAGARLTPTMLRLDPFYDKLRGDPRFDALTKGEPELLK